MAQPVLTGITVTGARAEGTPFEAPASVDVVDGASLREGRAQADLSEGLGAVPGLLLQNRHNLAQDMSLSLRGFGARSAFGIRGVRLYVDGIPATMPDGQGQSSHIDIASIDRVEVLRGPFSALYGNSSGGVVQVFSERGAGPPGVTAGFAMGEALQRGSLKGSGATDEGLDWLLSASHFDTDGYRPHSEARRSTGNGRLGLALSSDSRVDLVFNAVRVEAQDPLGLTAEQFKADPWQTTPQAAQFNTRKTVDQRQMGLTWQQRVDARNELQVLLYAGQRQTLQFLAIPQAPQFNPTHAGGVIDLARDYGGLDARWTARGESLELTGGLAADVLLEQRRGYENFTASGLGEQGALRRDERNRVHDVDPYAQARWQFAERWSLETGLRYSTVRFRSRDDYITAGNGDDSGEASYRRLLPVAALRWQASDTLAVHAALGRGFETPTLNELSYRADGQPGLNFGLRPSVSTNVELGVKRQGPDSLLTAALFQTRTEDEIVTAGNSGGRATYRNAGRTLRQGMELAGRLRHARHAQAQLAYTWLDATYRDGFCGAVCTADSQAEPGNQLPGVPRQVMQAEWAWLPLQGWRGGLELRHAGRMAANDGNSEFAPAVTTLAAQGGYLHPFMRHGELAAFARVDNLTGRRYAGSVIVNESNRRYYESAPGRRWSVGVSANYGF
jgi:iron complex outermembrane receptor protein